MSYTLEIWEPHSGEAAPVDLGAVMALLERLHSLRPGVNPKFRELARRLTRGFPDITPQEAQSLPEHELAWTDGPPRGDGESAVLVLGLTTPLLGEVRPFVIAEANSLGLGVFDPQAGDAHLPGGVRYGVSPPRAAAAETRRSRTCAANAHPCCFRSLTPRGR